ncbi:MAG: hypothetical protein MOB07_28850 [Acidobacteria bacterium]|nr:hypothetical protein [Acidobacteriota bacterium]
MVTDHDHVTIQNLEVQFDVDGEGDDAAFARLFEKYIRQWARKQEEAQAREKWIERERSLGDRREEYD